jgi:hypothetical protein
MKSNKINSNKINSNKITMKIILKEALILITITIS